MNNGEEAWRMSAVGDEIQGRLRRPMGDKKRRLLFDVFPVVVQVQVAAMKAFKATPALENEGNPARCDPIDRAHVVHKKLIRSVQLPCARVASHDPLERFHAKFGIRIELGN